VLFRSNTNYYFHYDIAEYPYWNPPLYTSEVVTASQIGDPSNQYPAGVIAWTFTRNREFYLYYKTGKRPFDFKETADIRASSVAIGGFGGDGGIGANGGIGGRGEYMTGSTLTDVTTPGTGDTSAGGIAGIAGQPETLWLKDAATSGASYHSISFRHMVSQIATTAGPKTGAGGTGGAGGASGAGGDGGAGGTLSTTTGVENVYNASASSNGVNGVNGVDGGTGTAGGTGLNYDGHVGSGPVSGVNVAQGYHAAEDGAPAPHSKGTKGSKGTRGLAQPAVSGLSVSLTSDKYDYTELTT
jgi:hypothetical protein